LYVLFAAGGVALLFEPPAVAAAAGYPYSSTAVYSATYLPGGGDSPDLPHLPEPGGTEWTPYDGAATTVSTARVSRTGQVVYGYAHRPAGPGRDGWADYVRAKVKERDWWLD
jgi:hypothetical protein